MLKIAKKWSKLFFSVGTTGIFVFTYLMIFMDVATEQKLSNLKKKKKN